MHELLVKNEEFKDSPVGKIPKDWDVRYLKDLTDSPDSITYGVLKPGQYVSNGIPLLQIQDVIHGNIQSSKLHLISKQLDAQYSRTRLSGGEIVISLVGTIGKIAQIPIWLAGANLHRNLAKIPISRGNSSRFIYHYLQSNLVQKAIAGSTFGSTQSLLNLAVVRELLVIVPPPQEQIIIAETIDTLDRAIAQTSALITKLKQTKAGLLHDLLTRGLDENGQLRNPQTHPQQFKESAIGLIPKEWDIFKLLEVLPRAEYGISVSLDDEVGTPVLRMNNLKDGEVELTDLKKSASIEAANLLLKPFDVLFNRTNSIEHVGRTGIWRGQIEQASFASYLVRLIPEQSKLIPEYLNIWLNLQRTQLVIRRYATPGVHQVNINPTNLRKVLIILPQKISEQEAIVKIVDSHDTRIRKEEAYLSKLKLQKQGLMQDLLTGKVRVKAVG
jgi:type I restriction enzyme, S subunit